MIERHQPDVFMLSMGGNDVLGDGRFIHLLNDHTEGAEVEDLINQPRLNAMLAQLMGHYRTMLAGAFQARPGLRVFVHGYANALPREDGRWLGKALERKGIPLKTGKEIVARVLGRINTELARLAGSDPRIEYFNLRGQIKDHYGAWHDELHLSPRSTAPSQMRQTSACFTVLRHVAEERFSRRRSSATRWIASATTSRRRKTTWPSSNGSLTSLNRVK